MDFSQLPFLLPYHPTENQFRVTDELLAIRLVSVIFSILALVPFFLIVKKIYQPYLGILFYATIFLQLLFSAIFPVGGV